MTQSGAGGGTWNPLEIHGLSVTQRGKRYRTAVLAHRVKPLRDGTRRSAALAG